MKDKLNEIKKNIHDFLSLFSKKTSKVYSNFLITIKNLVNKSKGKKNQNEVSPDSETPPDLSLSKISDQDNEENTSEFKSKFKNSLRNLSSTSNSFDKFIQSFKSLFLDIENRSVIHNIFIYSFFIILSYNSGKILAKIIGGTQVKELNDTTFIESKNIKYKKNIQNIIRDDVFKTSNNSNKKIVKKKKKVNKNKVCKDSQNRSNLPIKLLSTIVIGKNSKSLASLRVGSSPKTLMVRQGEKIKNLAKLSKITRLRIDFINLNSGRCEYINNTDKVTRSNNKIKIIPQEESSEIIKQKIKGIENDGNNFKISKKLLKEKLTNMSDIIQQARGIPMPQSDGSLHFKIVDIEPGSIYSFLGIQNEDVITEINGDKVKNLNSIMNLFSNITNNNLSGLKLKVNRDGDEVDLDYKIE